MNDMTFADARKRHMTALHRQLVELESFANDPSWTNMECKEFKVMVHKLEERFKDICRLNDSANSIPSA
jgi:Fe-S-cluster formation regulator IscX/YfhJ